MCFKEKNDTLCCSKIRRIEFIFTLLVKHNRKKKHKHKNKQKNISNSVILSSSYSIFKLRIYRIFIVKIEIEKVV